MFWTEIEGEELQRLRSRIELQAQTAILEASTLRTPFYHNAELVKINDGMGTMFMVAVGPGEISAREYYPLNGNGADIHAANKAAKLVITQDNAGDYLRYFTAFLRNDEGEPFAIIESLNGFGLVGKDRQTQQKPDDMRLVCEGANEEGNVFAFRGYMAYEGQMFGVSVLVHTNGYVEMLNDDPMGFIVPVH